MEHQINWMAVAAALVAQIVIGFIWFNPAVMGKVWSKASGMSLDDMKPANPILTYGLNTLFTLMFTMWLVTNVTGPGQDAAPDGHSYHTFQHGIAHALFLCTLVITPIFAAPAMFEKRGWKWAAVHIGYWFVRLFFAAGIISVWR